MKLLMLLILLVATSVVLAPATSHAQAVDGFQPRTFTGSGGTTMPYRLFVPDAQARAKPLPVIIYLHGSGGIGTDNLKQISGGNTGGTHVWTTPEAQGRHPAFVVAPQLPPDTRWDAPAANQLAPYAALLPELLTSLSKEFGIDKDRVYLIGQSLGGRGTWDIITKRPELFAAAVPVCGDGTPSRAAAARSVPIWAFHGAKDEVIPVAGDREMVAALRALGSPIKYTEYPDSGHDVWTQAFADKDLSEWLFAQRRAHS